MTARLVSSDRGLRRDQTNILGMFVPGAGLSDSEGIDEHQPLPWPSPSSFDPLDQMIAVATASEDQHRV